MAALLVLLAPVPSAAQYTSGRVEGTILDRSGAAFPGPVVCLQHLSTNTVRSFTTGGDGFYIFLRATAGQLSASGLSQFSP